MHLDIEAGMNVFQVAEHAQATVRAAYQYEPIHFVKHRTADKHDWFGIISLCLIRS